MSKVKAKAKVISLSYDIVGFIFQTAFELWDVQKKLFMRKQWNVTNCPPKTSQAALKIAGNYALM